MAASHLVDGTEAARRLGTASALRSDAICFAASVAAAPATRISSHTRWWTRREDRPSFPARRTRTRAPGCSCRWPGPAPSTGRPSMARTTSPSCSGLGAWVASTTTSPSTSAREVAPRAAGGRTTSTMVCDARRWTSRNLALASTAARKVAASGAPGSLRACAIDRAGAAPTRSTMRRDGKERSLRSKSLTRAGRGRPVQSTAGGRRRCSVCAQGRGSRTGELRETGQVGPLTRSGAPARPPGRGQRPGTVCSLAGSA